MVWVLRYAPDRALLMSPLHASQLITGPQIPMVQVMRPIPALKVPESRGPVHGLLAAGAHHH